MKIKKINIKKNKKTNSKTNKNILLKLITFFLSLVFILSNYNLPIHADNDREIINYSFEVASDANYYLTVEEPVDKSKISSMNDFKIISRSYTGWIMSRQNDDRLPFNMAKAECLMNYVINAVEDKKSTINHILLTQIINAIYVDFTINKKDLSDITSSGDDLLDYFGVVNMDDVYFDKLMYKDGVKTDISAFEFLQSDERLLYQFALYERAGHPLSGIKKNSPSEGFSNIRYEIRDGSSDSIKFIDIYENNVKVMTFEYSSSSTFTPVNYEFHRYTGVDFDNTGNMNAYDLTDSNKKAIYGNIYPTMELYKEINSSNQVIDLTNKFKYDVDNFYVVVDASNAIKVGDVYKTYFAVNETSNEQIGIYSMYASEYNDVLAACFKGGDGYGFATTPYVILNQELRINKSILQSLIDGDLSSGDNAGDEGNGDNNVPGDESELSEGNKNGLYGKKECGDWILEFYKKNKESLLYLYSKSDSSKHFIMDFNKEKWYKIYFKYKPYSFNKSFNLGLQLDTKTTIDEYSKRSTKKFYSVGSVDERYAALLVNSIATPDQMEYEAYDLSFDASSSSDDSHTLEKAIQNMFMWIKIADATNKQGTGVLPRVIINIYDSTISEGNNNKKGEDEDNKLVIDNEKPLLSDVNFDITDWIIEDNNSDISNAVSKFKNTGKIIGQIAGNISERNTEFMQMIFKYSKTLILMFIFLMVIFTGLWSISKNQDSKERVKIKEKLGHIMLGAFLFSLSLIIVMVAKDFMVESFSKIDYIASANNQEQIEEDVPTYSQGFILDIVQSIVEILTWAFQRTFDYVFKTVLGNGSSKLDIGDLLFNSEGVDGITLYPFTEMEWTRYMYGYRCLLTMAIGLLAIAIVKVAFDMILNSGNTEKIMEAKQSIIRCIIAIVGIILGPYLMRFILLVFNSAVKLVPVEGFDFDFDFSKSGLIGAMADFTFVWIKFKIYLSFLVRKIMLAFLLILTPIVFSMWAISNKFRTVGLWVGELFTNAATQFSYAMVFFIITIILYVNVNDFVSLIIILMMMKLVNFFRDSLQGLLQKWGGIDELGIADNLAGNIQSWGKKGKGIVKTGVGAVGGIAIKGSDFFDENKATTKGRYAYNIGSIMQGDFFGVRTKYNQKEAQNKLAKTKQSELYSERKYLSSLLDDARKDPEFEKEFSRAKSGNMSDNEIERLENEGGTNATLALFAKKTKEYQKYKRLEMESKRSMISDTRQGKVINAQREIVKQRTLDEMRKKQQNDKKNNSQKSPYKLEQERNKQINERNIKDSTYASSKEELAKEFGNFLILSNMKSENKIDNNIYSEACENFMKHLLETIQKGDEANKTDNFLLPLGKEIVVDVTRKYGNEPKNSKEAKIVESVTKSYKEIESKIKEGTTETTIVANARDESGNVKSFKEVSQDEAKQEFKDIANARTMAFRGITEK